MFIQSSTWSPKQGQGTGLDLDLGPSLGQCKTAAKPPEKETPEYMTRLSGAHTGTLMHVIPDRYFGFIKPDDGGEDMFFHFKSVIDGNLRFYKAGAKVAYEQAPDRKTGAIRAVDVHLIDPSGETQW